jgi:Fe2+ transport system protein FeoA
VIFCALPVKSSAKTHDRADVRHRIPRPEKAPVPLSQLSSGAVGRVQNAELAHADSALLRALGLTTRSLIRVCKSGDPCIVQVRTTRIGLSRKVAENILVIPEAR